MNELMARGPEREAQPTAPAKLSGPKRLLIVSHVRHYRHDGQLGAYGPYAREIDIWADLFESVVIAAPLRRVPFPGDCLPFTRIEHLDGPAVGRRR